MNYIEIIPWISVILTLIAAYMNASKNANLKHINILYFISNFINLTVFLYCQIWPYFILACILLIIAGKGIRTNRYIPLISKEALEKYYNLTPIERKMEIYRQAYKSEQELREKICKPYPDMSKMKWTKKGWVPK